MGRDLIKNNFILLASLALLLSCAGEKPSYEEIFPAAGNAEGQLLKEHRDLLAAMDSALYGDSSWVALQTLVRHHFEEEERIVFPLLAVLPALADGKLPAGPETLIAAAAALRDSLGHLSAEHQMVHVLLEEVSARRGDERFLRFRDALQRHARLEEEVLFPAAILAGEAIRVRTGE